MKPWMSFLCSPRDGRRYNNVEKIGGVDMIVSSSEESVEHSNRYAVVEELPARYSGPIKKGDTLLVHHNVFKYYNDMKGRKKSGKSFFSPGMFLIDDEQYFMYNNGEEWIVKEGFCFIKALPMQDRFLGVKSKNEAIMGEVVYLDETLKRQGLKKGDHVLYKPSVRYKFNVDGEELYRLYSHQVVAMIEDGD